MNQEGLQFIPILKYKNQLLEETEDVLAIEAPLEIQIVRLVEGKWIDQSIAVTMRTPGNDQALGVGFLFTEGILESESQIHKILQAKENILTILLKEFTQINIEKLSRNFYTTSSCGICGKTSIELIKTQSQFNCSMFNLTITSKNLFSFQTKILAVQSLFSQTGGIHAAALFDENATLIDLQEDVGRHNAVDKLLGNAFLKNKFPLSSKTLMLSGRASFELIQKASMAGIPIVVALGAPSSLAVELAQEMGITLIGFLKKEKFNVYCHPDRIKI